MSRGEGWARFPVEIAWRRKTIRRIRRRRVSARRDEVKAHAGRADGLICIRAMLKLFCPSFHFRFPSVRWDVYTMGVKSDNASKNLAQGSRI